MVTARHLSDTPHRLTASVMPAFVLAAFVLAAFVLPLSPAAAQAGCTLSDKAVAAAGKGAKYDAFVRATGCQGKRISSFEMLGGKTEVYWFEDGDKRLQVTFRNGALQSARNTGVDPVITGSPR
ncbi:hypothetical protein NK718_18040 [Alsobacter sp. SYSU M60028]|uniref:PepSY domain-containing protein n=1 Tax=Alsobacter ponti TaxID=2962936 RepID=A0ABT1LIA2_9HYPH|nr:hypothetical protein [Alsobacter ponti]MCP8940430.1 hypothetical protein [Alsobacter ponti]